jgi:serine/threonine protein kinase
VKLGDFGLSQTLFPGDYVPLTPGGTPMPLRWLAPESLNGKPFSAKTDVWSATLVCVHADSPRRSFGVLFWEIFTYGNSPYPSMSTSEIQPFIVGGGHPEPPKICPPEWCVFIVLYFAHSSVGSSCLSALVPPLTIVLLSVTLFVY